MRYLSFLFNPRMMGFLLILLAISMALGTFIEKSYDAATAKILIYDASWFEGLFILLSFNFIASIKRYKLFKQKKWGVLLLHLSFIIIIVGGGITRYFGYEGAISLKEGESTNQFITEKTYLTVLIDGDYRGKTLRKTLRKEVLFSPYALNHTQIKTNFKGIPIYIESTGFYTKNERGYLNLSLKVNEQVDTLTVIGAKGKIWPFYKINSHGLSIWINYGSIAKTLPFTVKLKDFIATRYPGTINSYSGFKSKVEVADEDGKFDYDIFMNHTLDHKGFRFYQASFHSDEKGSILSINHDYWGSFITYTGYFLLYASFLWIIFFDPQSHFRSLRKKLRALQSKQVIIILFSIGFQQSYSQKDFHRYSLNEIDSILTQNVPPKEISDAWGQVITQDNGRMKPINTYASELLRKLSKKSHYKNMDANQFLLSVTLFPAYWYSVPIIKLPRDNKKIRWYLGLSPSATHASLANFFTKNGFYKITVHLQKAHMTKQPNIFDRDLINLDQKVNLFYQILNGRGLNIFPIPNDLNQKWISNGSPLPSSLKRIDSLYIRHVFDMLGKQIESKDTLGTLAIIDAFKGFQKKYGKNTIPTDIKRDIEIAYNHIDLFNRLYKAYLILGIFALIVGIKNILKKKPIAYQNIIHFIACFLFILQTLGMAIRWYISGHAPWSDAYESLLYTSWSTALFTIFFSKKSLLTLAGGLFGVSTTLMVSHWSWLDPAINNLEPVLNSYWLMIHVSIIVSSYGPFLLSTVFGLICLILMCFKTKTNHIQIKNHIKELSIINEISIVIGLGLLTTGNFLGGQWANESWGRYWGWDPKETWALISIIVYVFIIHMRLIKGLRGFYAFNLMSILGFGSVLMTYFGVNFYLTGLHSYASGDQIITPNFVYVLASTILFIATFAFFRNKRFE